MWLLPDDRDVTSKDSANEERPGSKLVFLGLCDICGYYSQLERGLLQLGVPCTLVNAFPSIAYPRKTRPASWLGRLVEDIAQKRWDAKRGTLKRKLLTAVQAFWMGWLFLWSLFACRAYVFAGGTSFFAPYDLWLLKKLGKRVIVIFHGSGSRPPFIDGGVKCETPEEVAQCIEETRRARERIDAVNRNVDLVVDHVFGSYYHSKPFVCWLNIGIPCDVARFHPAPLPKGPGFTITHAPTNPGPKGSAYVQAAIENLEKKGYPIKFVKLTGRTNAEVLEAINQSDFVVDELFSDHTMCSFATEAAALGRTAVVGLYGFELLTKWTQPGLLPPATVCRYDGVEAAIESLLVDEGLRRKRGAEARKFVEEQWDCFRVAERLKHVIDGTVPESWMVDPNAVIYLHGWGLSDAQARARVGRIIAAGGVSALQLDDKPALRQAFVDFAKGA